MANLLIIKDILEKQKVSIEEFSKKLGMSSQNLHKIIRNNSTTLDTLEKIADELGVPITVFFDNQKDKSDKPKVFLAFELSQDQEDKVLKMVMGKEFINLLKK